MGIYPENTLLAFTQSINIHNVDIIEMDLQFTKDRKVIILHDDSIDRTTDGKGKVTQLTYDEILKFDAGYYFKDNKGRFLYRGKGLKVPLFEDVLKTLTNSYLNIELKQSSPKFLNEVIKLVNKYAVENKIIIGSGKYLQNKRIQQLLPYCCHYFSRLELYILLAIYPFAFMNKYWDTIQVIEAPVEYFGLNIYKLFIKISRSINKPIIFWGTNQQYLINSLSKLGARGVITDFPDHVI